MQYGLKVNTIFQRKSGDVFTFMGNTVTTMLALAFVYDLRDIKMGIFGGDDSIIVTTDTSPIPDRSKVLGELFNLDAKLDNFPYGHYFSSRFLIFVNGFWMYVPDPLKAISKLGRDDMFCKEHIKEYCTSFSDNYKLYKCADVRAELTKATYRKYQKYFINKDIDLRIIVDFLASLIDNVDKFYELYTGPRELWDRKLTPDLRREFKKRELQIEEFLVSMEDDLFIDT